MLRRRITSLFIRYLLQLIHPDITLFRNASEIHIHADSLTGPD